MRRGAPGRADPRWRVRPGPHAHVEPGGSRGRGLPARPQQQPRPSAQRVQGSGHHLRQTLTRLPLGARGASARRLRQGTHLAWLQEQSVARPPHADKLRPTTSEFGRNSGALPRDAVAAVRQDSRRPGDGPGRATRRRRCTLSTQSRREAGARWRPARAPPGGGGSRRGVEVPAAVGGEGVDEPTRAKSDPALPPGRAGRQPLAAPRHPLGTCPEGAPHAEHHRRRADRFLPAVRRPRPELPGLGETARWGCPGPPSAPRPGPWSPRWPVAGNHRARRARPGWWRACRAVAASLSRQSAWRGSRLTPGCVGARPPPHPAGGAASGCRRRGPAP